MTSRLGLLYGTRAKPVTEATASPVAPAYRAATIGRGDEGTARLIARRAEAVPPVDEEKVRSIRDAIAAGTYSIDAGAIAAKMIALDLPVRD